MSSSSIRTLQCRMAAGPVPRGRRRLTDEPGHQMRRLPEAYPKIKSITGLGHPPALCVRVRDTYVGVPYLGWL